MKRIMRIVGLGLVVALVLSSCTLLGFPSVRGRISQFQDALNQSDRSSINEHFSPTETANYNQIKDAAVFASGPLSYQYEPFEIIVISASDPENVSATVSNDNGVFDMSFRMVRDGLGWLIEEFTITAGGQDYTIKQIGL